MMTNRKLFFSLILAALLLLGGCIAAPSDMPQTTATPTVPLGNKIIQGVDAGGAAAIDSYLTQQAEDEIMRRSEARLALTQQAQDATATSQVREENAQATQRSDSATQRAWNVTVQAAYAQDTATAQARATATAQHILGVTATVEAAATATAVKATEEAPIVHAEATAIAAKAEKTVIDLRQAQAREFVDTWWVYVLTIIVVGVLILYIWKKSQVSVVTDNHGRVRVIMVGEAALNPDLMVRPVIEFGRKSISAPALGISDDTQRQIAHESKIVDAIASLPPTYPKQGAQLLGGMTGRQGGVNIQVIQPGQLDGIRRELDARLDEDDE